MRVVVYRVTGNDAWRVVAQRGAARARRLMATHMSRNPAATAAARCLAAKIPDDMCGDPDATTDPDIDEQLGLITMQFML